MALPSLTLAGLTADARVLCKWLRTESLNYKYVYEGQMPLNRLVRKLADKSQKNTQGYGGRPYGVGLLVVGYDVRDPSSAHHYPLASNLMLLLVRWSPPLRD